MSKLDLELQPTVLNADALQQLRSRVKALSPVRRIGFVNEIVVTTVKANLPDVVQGELCEIESTNGQVVLGEVIAFTEHEATISCLQSVVGIALGAKVTPLGKPHCVKADDRVMATVLDGMGRSMDEPNNWRLGVLSTEQDAIPVIRPAPPATQRPPVAEAFTTQIRVIDGLLTLGIGQRLGIFAPPGCGKSTLMAQIVRGANVDAVVFGLVGERGRELREFMEREISDDIRAKSFFVCATSDRSPIERVRAAFTATSIAEYLRDQGKSVLLVVDSLTRLARAQREVGLMAGEPSTQSGFTPSVYSILPELIERSGRTSKGSITAVYTVLMEGEKLEDDPIASEAKSLLDGHIVLSNKLVEKSHFPAIDVLKSLSRVASHVASTRTQSAAAALRRAYSLFQEVELLIRLNEYQPGTDPLIDEAVLIKPKLDEWCKQGRFDIDSPKQALSRLDAIVSKFESVVRSRG
ncbi:FliI/YscN family ATPase [Limnobacter parvus]|uniref:FliI/YscN family ATPase n=1 Tax=Limnobacter parvus TaxID=2939690 RepID=A0ABT1XIY8_9BURK|nr:FliI/YscN family ATPase [Limnobacter parvus]MCR2747253.1 FliI/YscN family ATPase [Limnobacter parvus]